MSENQLLLYIVISIAIMSVFALAIILFFNISQKKIQSEALKRQELKITFQKELLQRTIQTQEEERNRISRELHDDIGSKLNIIHLNIHLLKNDIDKGKNIQELLNDIDVSLHNSIETTRDISHQLVPPTLRKFGLFSAIEDLQRSISKTTVVKMIVENITQWELTGLMSQLHFYRIIQELVQNGIKHAKADHLIFTFEQKEDQIQMVYRDDGIGMPKGVDSKGLGMSNIYTRVQILNGEWAIDHQYSSGTRIVLNIPL